MDFLQLSADRYSVRKFNDREVEQEKIDLIIKAGMLAPTACNRQPQRIIVLKGEEDAKILKKITSSHFNAKTAFLICYNKNESWVREYDNKCSGDIDASIVTTHMMLEAAFLGIGSTWVMHFIPEAVQEELKLPEELEAVALLVVGYPAEDAAPSQRHSESRPVEELVAYHQFQP